jgi:hypothetical protein
MQVRKIIQRRIRRSSNGVDLVGDLNAAIAGSVGEQSSTTHVSSRSSVSAHSVRQGKGRENDDAEQGDRDT